MDKPPEQVEVDGKLYKINSDFRTSIQFEILMQKKELTEKQKEFANELCLLDKEMDRETAELLAKYKDGLELYYPEIPNDINEAINAMLWFYECGKENIDKKKSKKSGSGKKIYNYNYDADYIYAAFFEQYHIDLAEQELHWWKFSALFSALSEDCMISKIITYRVIDTKGMEKEQESADGVVCDCCGKTTHIFYTGPFYAVEDIEYIMCVFQMNDWDKEFYKGWSCSPKERAV